jgi:hypothetical protein
MPPVGKKVSVAGKVIVISVPAGLFALRPDEDQRVPDISAFRNRAGPTFFRIG